MRKAMPQGRRQDARMTLLAGEPLRRPRRGRGALYRSMAFIHGALDFFSRSMYSQSTSSWRDPGFLMNPVATAESQRGLRPVWRAMA
jgi:hypothetical protein